MQDGNKTAEAVNAGDFQTLPAECGPYEIQVNAKRLDGRGCFDESLKPYIIRIPGSDAVYRECDDITFPKGTEVYFTKQLKRDDTFKIRLVANGPIQIR